jgi:hypothetical protein
MISRSTLRFTKSSYSTNGGDCVELAATAAGVHVRDSKDPHGPVLTFAFAQFRDYLARVKSGDFDHLFQRPAVQITAPQDPDGPVLTFTPSEFRAFVAGAKDGEFDNLALQAA